VFPESPHSFIGAGTQHGDLATRFAMEDLREPIIKDNARDDDLLQEHLNKNRLGEWWLEAQRAARKAIVVERQQLALMEQDDEDAEEAPLAIEDAVDGAASGAVEAGPEGAGDQDRDVEMEEA